MTTNTLNNLTENGANTIILPERISAENAQETEAFIRDILERNGWKEFILDAGKTQYISSSGLRVLLGLKHDGYDFQIVNVNPEVYEIFDITGFLSLMTVRKKMRELSIEGLPVIGIGGTAKVYRIDPDTIIKVFSPLVTLATVEEEIRRTKEAFLKGIATTISYDVVKAGESYGIVYELIDAKTLAEEILAHPENEDALIVQYAEFMKEMHKISMGSDNHSAKQLYHIRMEKVRDTCPPDVYEKMCAMIDSIPERDTFTHGDFHPKNVMLEKGNMMLIDMGAVTGAHPVFDLMGLGFFRVLVDSIPDSYAIEFSGMEHAQLRKLWDGFLKVYFGTEDEETLKKINCVCLCYSAIRAWWVTAILPSFPEKITNYAIEAFKKYYAAGGDNLELLNL